MPSRRAPTLLDNHSLVIPGHSEYASMDETPAVHQHTCGASRMLAKTASRDSNEVFSWSTLLGLHFPVRGRTDPLFSLTNMRQVDRKFTYLRQLEHIAFLFRSEPGILHELPRMYRYDILR